MSRFSFATDRDRQTALNACPVYGPEGSPVSAHNDVRFVSAELSPKGKSRELHDLGFPYYKAGLDFYANTYCKDVFSGIRFYQYDFEGSTFAISEDARLGFLCVDNTSSFLQKPPVFEGLPYILFGEGVCSTRPSVFTNGGRLYNKTICSGSGEAQAVSNPIPLLSANRCWIDSISQLIQEYDEGSALSGGISSGLVSILAQTNHAQCICAYAPVLIDQDKDPLMKLKAEGYTSGILHSNFGMLSTDADYRDIEVFVTSRSPWPLSNPINVKDGSVDRTALVPVISGQKIYGSKYSFDIVSRALEPIISPKLGVHSSLGRFGDTAVKAGQSIAYGVTL